MKRPSIVFLAHFDWNSPFVQFHKEVLKEFVNLGWDALWVSGPAQSRIDLKHWIKSFPAGQLRREASIWHYQPWALPGLRFGSKLPLSYRLMAYHLRQVLDQLSFIEPTILVYTPYELELIKALPHSATIYWTGDEVIIPGEASLMDYVDLILAVSPPAYEEKRASQPNKTFQISTGVAFQRFNQALGSAVVPPDLSQLKRPIAGYAGSVFSTRVDLDLLAFLARSSPQFSFACVGPSDKGANEFFRTHSIPNLYPLGPREYEQIPYYINCFDVCIVPYKLNKFNLGSNPLKIYEYLALGKPVVATPLPSIEKFSELVWIARHRDQFLDFLGLALASKDAPDQVQHRLQVAKAHSAENIASEIVRLLGARAPVDVPLETPPMLEQETR